MTIIKMWVFDYNENKTHLVQGYTSTHIPIALGPIEWLRILL